MTKAAILSMTALSAAALAGCASTREPPTAQLATARALVQQAEPAAARYAPEQLRMAQAKLSLAQAAAEHEDYEQAQRLADEAALDARLADSMAEHQRLQAAVAQVNDGIRTLQDQLNRRTP